MKKVLAALLASTVVLTGCMTQTATLKPNTATTPTFEETQSFFISGIGQSKTINAVKICGGQDKIAKVESFWSAPNILLGAVTLGIYTPRTARVYCQ